MCTTCKSLNFLDGCNCKYISCVNRERAEIVNPKRGSLPFTLWRILEKFKIRNLVRWSLVVERTLREMRLKEQEGGKFTYNAGSTKAMPRYRNVDGVASHSSDRKPNRRRMCSNACLLHTPRYCKLTRILHARPPALTPEVCLYPPRTLVRQVPRCPTSKLGSKLF